ncbi:MAG TPA: hypothetical protein VHV30_06010 [Polyangiaceae bacterium]|nr:hypothetical protein [Polyangiaceae bacterium]
MTRVVRARMGMIAIAGAAALCAAASGACGDSTGAIPDAGADAPGEASADAGGPPPADAQSAPDSTVPPAPTDAGDHLFFVTTFVPNNQACLPEMLPSSVGGSIDCTILYALPAGDSCEAHAGLTIPSGDLATAVRSTGHVPASEELCALPQLPTSDWVSGSCAASTEVGWCYLTGAPAGGCDVAIRTSAALVPPAGASAILACGPVPTSTATAPDAAAVGTPCIPGSERDSTFGGFNEGEVATDTANATCGAGMTCLVNHFQGRTTCPYGQTAPGVSSVSGVPSCTVPGTNGLVQPPNGTVAPQCTDRRASDTVYCSCRCANGNGGTSDDGGPYCSCASGYACTPTTPTASYCLKADTFFEAGAAASCVGCGTTGTLDCP